MNENTNNEQNDDKSLKLTSEQKFFALSIKFLNEFDEIEKTRELTWEETVKKNKITTALWNKIIRYARSLIASSMENYNKYNDYMSELTQSIAAVFFQYLPYYSPQKGAPSTFFKPYFLQEITKYKRNDSQHMTPSEAINVRKVRQAVNYHESKNEPYDYQIISLDTGLSVNVVKKTFERMSNSQMVSIDDILEVAAKTDTPEQNFLKEEAKNEIWDAVDRLLDEDEKIFLFTKLNLDEEKSLTYKALAEKLNLEIHEVKSKWSFIQTKLASDPVLQKLNPTLKEVKVMKLNTHTNASDTMADDLLSNFENMDLDFKSED